MNGRHDRGQQQSQTSVRRLIVQTWACHVCLSSLASEPPADRVCDACWYLIDIGAIDPAEDVWGRPVERGVGRP